MKLVLVLVLVLALLAGCASPRITFENESSPTFARDEYECRREARTAAPYAIQWEKFGEKLYVDCMKVRGYTRAGR